MRKALELIGKILPYVLAAVACVSLAQFLLLIGISTQRAQSLAGETIGRAILCGAAAAWLIYRDRRKNRLKHPAETPAEAEPPSQGEYKVDLPPQLPDAQTNAPTTELPTKAGSSWGEVDGKFLVIFAGFFLVVMSAVIIGSKSNDLTKQGETFDTSANKNKPASSGLPSSSGTPPDNPLDQFLARQRSNSSAPESPATVSPCGSGVPAGVQIVPMSIIDTALLVTGSEGKALYDPKDHAVDYTLDEFAARGYNETSYDVGQWYFSFKVTNNTAVDRPDLRFAGYCIIAV